jgi:intergrase/recombinase
MEITRGFKKSYWVFTPTKINFKKQTLVGGATEVAPYEEGAVVGG